MLQPAPAQEDYLVAELWQEGTTGIVEEEGGIRAFFDDSADARRLLDRFANHAPKLRQEPRTDWEQVTRDAWPALEIGQRFFLVPPWSADSTPAGRLRLVVHPGMACGTGRHPATQLCLEALEQRIQPGDRVLDVGTGSGILAAASNLLGAGVIGCDVDHDAVAIARERVNLPLFTGSADAIRSNWADVIVANIDSAAIEHLGPEFDRVRKPAATLILSGFHESDTPQGFHAKRILRREEWVCLIC